MRKSFDLFVGEWCEIADGGRGRRKARKLPGQLGGIVDREEQRIRTGLFAMHCYVGENERDAKCLGFLDRGAPAFEAGGIDQRDRTAEKRIDVLDRDHAEIAEAALD